MKNILLVIIVLIGLNNLFGFNNTYINSRLTTKSIKTAEHTITITNGNNYNSITVYIYHNTELVGSIYITSGATRTFGIGNDPYYFYSYSVGDSNIKILFYSDSITIF